MPEELTALSVSQIREILPTTLGSAEIRTRIAVELRSNAVFSARTGNTIYLAKIKEVIDAVAAGRMDQATARLVLLETLRAIGYTPEGGFPDDPPGEVPEAIQGTLQDLSSRRRMDLIIDTQRALMIGCGQQLRGMQPERLKQFPAWELVRAEDRMAPRNWASGDGGTPPRYQGQPDMRSRWTIAGGILNGGRMIALKGDPIWGELGSSDNFQDALDTDHPPFAFQSGMAWREVSMAECKVLGVTGPNGESIEAWITEEHPLLTGTQPALPVPQIAVQKLPPEMVKSLEEKAGALVHEGTAYPKSADSDDLRDRITARRAAREARRQALATQAADKAAAAYEAKGKGGA